MNKNIALVVNPTRHNTKAVNAAEEVSGLLRSRGMNSTIFANEWPTGWDEFSAVWIFGGDGTANYFINENPDIRLPLSIFPSGSGNDFHYMLYGELDTVDQVNALLKGRTRLIDAGTCNGRLFLNGVGIGFDGAIVKDLLGKSKMAGKATYLLSVMKHIINYAEKECVVRSNAKFISKSCFMITVANGKRYGGDFNVAPNAVLDDGLLEMSVVGDIPAFKRIKYLPVIQKGEHLDLPFIDYSQAETVTINCESEIPAHIDGEYICSNSYEIKLLPKKFVFGVL